MSEAGSWNDTPPCVADGGQDMVAVFTRGGAGGDCQLQGELMSGWLIIYQGN